MLERLKTGLTTFKEVTYKKYERLYHDLEQTQDPHTLFIACSTCSITFIFSISLALDRSSMSVC